MSVGTLVIYRQGSADTTYLPLATESDYHAYWLPLANKNNLEWLPLFTSGISLKTEDIPYVLNELSEMQKAIAIADLSPERKEEMLERTNHLIQLLAGLDWQNVEEVFIG